jgi:CRISPR-associated endonuclease/helicase Cas3
MTSLYRFQQRVDELVRQGKNVILQAPTGAGKTRAALFPFLAAWRDADVATLPRQCIYCVPMRVLANQFEAEYRQIVEDYARRYGLQHIRGVRIQTGARPDDRKFESDLVFTTVDQFLSSFLTIPYSLSNRQANLNAGALIGSYLVFDEFHLFPVDETGNGALATTLHALKMLKGITPFVLMTATFSETMLLQLCEELDAVPVTLIQDEVNAIPSQQGKQRLYRYTAQELTPSAVASDFVQRQRQRAIVVCNTVKRARELAAALRTDPTLASVHIELLHSQFYARDRTTKEVEIRREFGEDRSQRVWGPAILVATQVIEVGLNITCDVLHTELAPASAIIQRAGRCARFSDESGTVLVYDVPLNEQSMRDWAPYIDSPLKERSQANDQTADQSELCERTLTAFGGLPIEGAVLNYQAELDLVNEAHEEFDAKLLTVLHENRHGLRAAVERVLLEQDRSAARELIRDVENRTIIVHHNPNETTVSNPYRYEGIGVRRGTLLGWFTAIQEQALALELDWVAKIPTAQEKSDAGMEAPEQHRRMQTDWQLTLRPSTKKEDIREGCNALAGAGLVALNPALVSYDAENGFRFEISTPAEDSPLSHKNSARDEISPLYRETYAQHITGLYRAYASDLRDRTAAVRRRLEERHELEPGALDRSIRLMFAVHDLGKLDHQWQEWAHVWQDKVSELRKTDRRIAAAYMAAHTDYDGTSRTEWQENKNVRPKRPPHAAESARAARNLIRAVACDCDALSTALMTAIMCHHSATIRVSHGSFMPANGARPAFNDAIRCLGLGDDPVLKSSGARVEWSGFPAADDLSEDIIDVERKDEVILYLFLARVLRMADQRSQEQPD